MLSVSLVLHRELEGGRQKHRDREKERVKRFKDLRDIKSKWTPTALPFNIRLSPSVSLINFDLLSEHYTCFTEATQLPLSLVLNMINTI